MCLFLFQNKSPLHSINWLRVVLDEGHVVKNPNAQMSKAVLGLKAKRRWILSGIPALKHTSIHGLLFVISLYNFYFVKILVF